MSPSDPLPAGPAAGSGTTATGQVELVSRNGSLELSIVASDFRPLASGMGRLSASLAPGIYQVVARAGPIVERKLIRLEAGAVYRDDNVAVAFPSPAPVRDTSTSHDYQQVAAERASNAIAQASGPTSGLVIVVRDVRGHAGPPLEAGDVACFGLFDQWLTPVDGFAQEWTIQAGEAVATWSRRLPAGGYALRTDPTRGGSTHRRSTSKQAFDQSIWLSANWQTIVFITTGAGGPQSSAASVHMTSVYLGWSPYETDVGHALELANLGLREGRSVLPDDLLGVLLGTKFVNPMLGVVGAHSLLLRHEPDPDLLEVVLKNLDGMMPGHPDVLALRWLAATRLAGSGGAAGAAGAAGAGGAGAAGDAAAGVPDGGASWPPMLLPSYRALIDMDAAHSNAIADGSVAERAAANLLVQGIWTSWAPLSTAGDGVAVPMESPRRGGLRGGVRGVPRGGAPGQRSVSIAGVLPALAAEPALIDRLPQTDPATARVAAYLGALAALEGPSGRVERFASLSPQEIGMATTLPAATVERALARIGTAVVPAGGGGGGSSGPGRGSSGRGGGSTGRGGLIRRSVPFLAAGALLLAGVVGAVAWCAGNEACPVPIGPANPTATLTAVVTPEATPIPLEHRGRVMFGNVTANGSPGQRRLTILAGEPVAIRFEFAKNPGGVFAVDDACQLTATPFQGFSCTVVVAFSPQRVGEYSGTLVLFAAQEDQSRRIRLDGEAIPPVLTYPGAQDFEVVPVKETRSREVVVSGTGRVPLENFIEDDANDAYSTERTCDWVEQKPGLFECAFDVTFKPPDDTQFSATLIISGGPKPPSIELTGSGTYR